MVYGAKKGVYIDGYKRPNVVESHKTFLKKMKEFERFMCTYNDKTLEPISLNLPPNLPPGVKEHVLITQDESNFHVNDQDWELWLMTG
ncbi:hypothetical protein ACEPAI_6796 [Sanghuangporus weigelae]